MAPKEEIIRKMPYIETMIEKSKCGKYLIHTTTITSVRSVEYYKAIMDKDE